MVDGGWWMVNEEWWMMNICQQGYLDICMSSLAPFLAEFVPKGTPSFTIHHSPFTIHQFKPLLADLT